MANAYAEELRQLTSDSKPLINMLTLLAEENVKNPEPICIAIENRIMTTGMNPLPCLFLIDSIMKNVKGGYVRMFEIRIVRMFTQLYRSYPKARSKAKHVRSTWGPCFNDQTLGEIDRLVGVCIFNHIFTFSFLNVLDCLSQLTKQKYKIEKSEKNKKQEHTKKERKKRTKILIHVHVHKKEETKPKTTQTKS